MKPRTAGSSSFEPLGILLPFTFSESESGGSSPQGRFICDVFARRVLLYKHVFKRTLVMSFCHEHSGQHRGQINMR